MADTKLYVGYVSYYIRNLGQNLSDGEWKDALKNSLGSSLSKVSVKTWKEFALKLYYIHFIGLSLRLDTDDLIKSDRSVSELREILVASDKFREEHELSELPVVHYVTDKEAIKHMQKFHAPESIIDDVMNSGVKTAKSKVSKPKAAKPAKKKSPTTKASSTKTKATKTKATKGGDIKEKKAVVAGTKIPAFLLVKQGKKTVTLTKREDIIKHLHGVASGSKTTVSTKSTKKSPSKSCGSYTITELRKMAQEKEVAGRSKMNKAELCKALKIKA
jgi:hypothetical protein